MRSRRSSIAEMKELADAGAPFFSSRRLRRLAAAVHQGCRRFDVDRRRGARVHGGRRCQDRVALLLRQRLGQPAVGTVFQAGYRGDPAALLRSAGRPVRARLRLPRHGGHRRARDLPADKEVWRRRDRRAHLQIETPEQVADRIRKVIEVVPPSEVYLTTDCGMKPLARIVARMKLKAWPRRPGSCARGSARPEPSGDFGPRKEPQTGWAAATSKEIALWTLHVGWPALSATCPICLPRFRSISGLVQGSVASAKKEGPIPSTAGPWRVAQGPLRRKTVEVTPRAGADDGYQALVGSDRLVDVERFLTVCRAREAPASDATDSVRPSATCVGG